MEKSEVEILNTNAWKKHPFNFFVNTVRLLKNCENVLILPADNGLRIVAPIYDFFNRFFKHKILYIVIGGFLPEFLKNNPSYVKMLNKYECLFVQTPNLKNDLKDLGLKHIELMTNFKLQSKREPNDIVLDENKNISVCVWLNRYIGDMLIYSTLMMSI